MVYISIFLFGVRQTTATCSTAIWMLNVGLILFFSSLIAKVWRIFTIFGSAKKLKIIKIPDPLLALIVMGFVSITLIILIVWQATFPVSPKLILLKETNYIRNQCTSDNYYVFSGILAFYYIFLLLAGVYIGYKTRKLDQRYSESKAMAMTIYQSILLGVVMIPIAVVVKERVFLYNIGCALLWISTTISVFILFLPKFYYIGKLSQDDIKLFGSKGTTGLTNSKKRGSSGKESNTHPTNANSDGNDGTKF